MDISILCSIDNVSRSGYYRWLAKSNLPGRDHEDYLLIKQIFESGKKKYGWRSIQMRLPKDRPMNHKKIRRIMRKYGLDCRIRRKNPYKQMAKATKEHRTFDNRLDRNFEVKAPFRVFCTDITYMIFNRRVAYLSVIKDVCSGEIVAWKLSRHIDMELVLDTIERLKNNTAIPDVLLADIMIHSDQGFHYTNPRYIELIKTTKMVQSMSRKGNCIDNAPMESFFGHLKDDIDYKRCKTFEELDVMIEEYMRYYNNERYQWGLKKMTPVEYRNHLLSNE